MTESTTLSRAQTLRQLELTVNRRLDGLLHGDHRGLIPGAGTEPGEGREYRVGDDVRRMDWNLTARTTIPHIREAIADRELETWIVADQSASLDFGTALCEKRDLSLAAAAAFAFLTARSGNRVGGVTLTGGEVVTFPARTGRDAAFALLHRIDDAPRLEPGAAAGPGLADLLVAAQRTARRRGLVPVISDFLDRGPWPIGLRGLASRHQVVAVEVRDPREDELPPVGFLTLVDPETGRRFEVQTQNANVRRRFAEAAAAQRETIRTQIVAAGAAHLVLRTDRDWLSDIVRFVEKTRKRR
jgi:uncharacterized protein (DUF58 family)